ncbi:MAG: hypothetical protein MZU97_07880 [Bacillus subtilis]|nr:hypothetical protein [Bacillus subtilis]
MGLRRRRTAFQDRRAPGAPGLTVPGRSAAHPGYPVAFRREENLSVQSGT